MKSKITALIAGLILIGGAGTTGISEIPPQGEISKRNLQSVIDRGKRNILSEKIDNEYWNMPSYLGANFISLYYCLTKWYNKKDSLVDEGRLRRMLLHTQLPDGSWYNVKDANVTTGNIDFTIFNYFALKAMGTDTGSGPMSRARNFILSKGGMEGSSLFTKIWMALFRNYPWDDLPAVPILIYTDSFPVNYTSFSQWVTPHMVPIAYLKKYRISKDLGPRFDLTELWKGNKPALETPAPERDFSELETIFTFILKTQQPMGSWGGYTMSSLLTIMVLEDIKSHFPRFKEGLDPMITKSFGFIEELYFKTGPSAYRGVLDDGRFWDTALLALALINADYDGARLEKTGQYLIRQQHENGGFPFGLDFWYAPDTDDTAEIIMALYHMGMAKSEINDAVSWLKDMQNKDGGWGAFDKNNNGNIVIDFIARDFKDSVDLFDDSCPDLTGHILEALGTVGLTVKNSETCRSGVSYLKKTQNSETGSWDARWGINHIYGTGAAVVGLVKAGEDPDSAYIRRALKWLISRQNSDGGWGETTRSYDDMALAGRGVSTPSQTAWALLALIEAGLEKNPAVVRGIGYLVREFNRDGKWIDRSTVGTGHPRILYMNYPSYPYAFPLMAVAKYCKAVYTK